MSRHAGIPLLSGPPPPHSGPSQGACLKCGKEFFPLFHRQHKCMHCGYGYCSSCTDYQALMPRRGAARGYDPVSVCAFCIDMLNVTALGPAQLRSLPLAKLRRYINAYNIPVRNPVDKNDLVDAAVAARTSQGCLSSTNEDYYRKHSVPPCSPSSSSSANRNSAGGPPNSNANSNTRSNVRSFPRPDLDPNRRQRPQETTRPTPNTQRPRTTSAPINPGTVPASGQANIPRPTSSSGPPPTSSAQASSHSQSAPPPPPMTTLVTLPRSSLSALPVGTLKRILWESRVRIPPAVIEKEELVERVWALIEEEKRRDSEGMDDIAFDTDDDEIDGVLDPDGEEEVVQEVVDLEPGAQPEHRRGNSYDAAADAAEHSRGEGDGEAAHEDHYAVPRSRPNTPQPSTSRRSTSESPQSAASKSKPRPHAKPSSAERSGLCVICQDEEANIAIVDCGHLAMCRACSELVLASSKECPLCRTRIVTEARLLRIFKT